MLPRDLRLLQLYLNDSIPVNEMTAFIPFICLSYMVSSSEKMSTSFVPKVSTVSGPNVTNLEASSSTMVVMKNNKCVILEKNNYFSWEAQFSAMLHGFKVMKYVKRTIDLSSATAMQQDQLILSWILTRISSSILP